MRPPRAVRRAGRGRASPPRRRPRASRARGRGAAGSGSRGIERRDVPVDAQRLRLGREPPRGEQRVEALVLGEQRRRRLRSDPARAGDLVRRVAAQRDEVRHLRRVDAVALAHLRRPDPRELAHALQRLQDRDVGRRELERVAVGGRDERRAAAPPAPTRRPRRGSRRPRTRRLRADDTRRREQARRELELLEQLRVELAPRLVAGEQLVAVGRDGERVPADEHRARPLRLPEPQHHRDEPGEQVPRPAVRAPDRARQRVERPVRERVAVDREQHRGRGGRLAPLAGHASSPSPPAR